MNRIRNGRVPIVATALSTALAPLITGCIGPDLNATAEPLVVTEGGTVSYVKPQSPERAAVVTDIRLQAEAGEHMPYPDVFQSEQRARLAARAEPRSVAEAEAIQLELAAIARRRQAAVSRRELAELDRRAAILRRLAAEAQAGHSP
jgi:hypothetical protein